VLSVYQTLWFKEIIDIPATVFTISEATTYITFYMYAGFFESWILVPNILDLYYVFS
jgi:hypothetical protein